MNGRIDDWKALKYNLNVESTVDLTQTSNTFPLGTTLRGVGTFKGVISGEGETYHVEGAANSDSLAAGGVYLKAVNVEGTVAGTNSNYEANGKAVAELLTFQDFRVEFPRLSGNIRGTGTDFRWVGELQAAAAKSGAMTIGGLYLADSVAELHDEELDLNAGAARARKFSAGDTDFTDLAVRNFRLTNKNGGTNVSAANGTAGSLANKSIKLNGISGSALKVKNSGGTTDVQMNGLRASSGELKGSAPSNLTAGGFKLTDRPNSTSIGLNNVHVDQATANGATVAGVDAPSVTINDSGGETVIYSDKNRVASIQVTGAPEA